ncbi:hypothetical protein O3P69_002746 [Scylla paramamosain]|uniref:Uncharacterized protein n=1 Tax=Scylla paramamosain TaxID=85552 RepID=A0AAW0UM52_SCYPA
MYKINTQFHHLRIRKHYLLHSTSTNCASKFFESEGLCFIITDKPGEDMTGEVEGTVFDSAEELEEFSINWLEIYTLLEHVNRRHKI